MIVRENSPIPCIPREISPREILILEGIRYSANMAFVSYGRLRANLHDISISIDPKPIDFFYAALNDAWGIIDSANRFYKLVSKLNIKAESVIHNEYLNFKKLRDGFHHIDEWIESKHVKEHYALFGVLTWRNIYVMNRKYVTRVWKEFFISI